MALEPAVEPLEPTREPLRSRAVRRRFLAAALVVLAGMRPRQWVKNAFVLAGVIFAGRVLDPAADAAALAVTAAFCLASGAAYLLNDVRDADADRADPRTAGRPVASGVLSPGRAIGAAGAAAGGALLVAAPVNDGSVAIVAAYLALQVTYSYKLKHIAVADVAAIAAGFVLRAAAGGVAVDVRVSPWLLTATGALALFLACAKRRGELALPGPPRAPRRAVLTRYSPVALDRALTGLTAATPAIYVLYAAVGAPSRWMLLTVPFVLLGLLRAAATIRRNPARGDDPTLFVLRDRLLIGCVALWAACAAVVAALAG